MILKDENGRYVSRGWRNLKINGENIKPILAAEVKKQESVRVFEHVNITDLRYDTAVRGAYGFGLYDAEFVGHLKELKDYLWYTYNKVVK